MLTLKDIYTIIESHQTEREEEVLDTVILHSQRGKEILCQRQEEWLGLVAILSSLAFRNPSALLNLISDQKNYINWLLSVIAIVLSVLHDEHPSSPPFPATHLDPPPSHPFVSFISKN